MDNEAGDDAKDDGDIAQDDGDIAQDDGDISQNVDEEGPFNCDKCKYVGRIKMHLLRHQKNQHAENKPCKLNISTDICLVPWPGPSTWLEELMNGLLIH